MSEKQKNIYAAFEFTAEDVAANQAGQLSPQQENLLVVKNQTNLMWWLWVIMPTGLCGCIALGEAAEKVILMILLLSPVLILAVLLGWIGLFPKPYQAIVKSATGWLDLGEHNTLSINQQGKVIDWSPAFQLTSDQINLLKQFPKNQLFTIYYVQNPDLSFDLLLSFQVHSPDKDHYFEN